MARNRGKRPSTASGSSPSQSQGKDQNTKVSGADTGSSQKPGEATISKTTTAASSAIAAKIEPPKDISAKPQSADGGASSEASKTPVSAKTETASAAGSKTTSASSGGAAKPSSTTTSSTGKTGASSAGGSIGQSRPTSSGDSGSGSGGSGSGSSGGGGFWPGLIGGVIGGAAAAFLLAVYGFGGDGERAAELESRLAAAEEQASEIGGLDQRLAAIESQPEASADGGEDLAARLAELEASLAALSGAAEASTADGGLGERLAALEESVGTLTSDVAAASEAQASAAETLASLAGALPNLETTLSATGASVEETTAKTDALDQSLTALGGDVQGLTDRVGAAESQLDRLGGEFQRGAAMIVAIGDVDRAITRSEPFDNPLESLKLLVRDDSVIGETLSVLEPMAADGVPTLAALKSDYAFMASRVLLAEEGDPSLTDQVGNNVFGILNMRPAGGDAEGGDSRAVLARAQSKLSANDLSGALGELGGLEGAAAEAAGDWMARAEARLSAEAAVVDLRAHAQSLVAEGS